MKLFFQPTPLNSLVRGILSIGIGITFLFIPGLTLKSVIMSIGAMILLSGSISLLFSLAGSKRRSNSTLVQSLFNLMLGIFFLVSPMAIVKIFGFIFGTLFLLIGTVQFFSALGTITRSMWSWVYLIFGGLMISAGLFLLVRPIESAENVLTFFGAIILLYGLLEILTAWRLKNRPPVSGPGNIVDTTYEEV